MFGCSDGKMRQVKKGNNMIKYLPNTITFTRFIFALLVAFSEPLSIYFWVFYGLALATDLIDGPLARKLKVNTNFGSTLDTIADIFLVICLIVCIFPILEVSVLSYILIVTVFLLKSISLIYAYIKFKKIVSYHAYFIKFSAVVIFAFPFWIMFFDENSVILVLAILQAAVYIEELLITRASDKADANAKSIFHVRNQRGI